MDSFQLRGGMVVHSHVYIGRRMLYGFEVWVARGVVGGVVVGVGLWAHDARIEWDVGVLL